MWRYLQHLSYWDWLALGTFLLILEMFGAGGYLLWIGIAAAGVGVFTFVIPTLDWTIQYLLFGLLSVFTTVFWWRRHRGNGIPSDPSGLNMHGQELIGQVFVVQESIIGGRGKIKVGDSVWIVKGPDMPMGAQARVVGQEGAVLLVEKAE
ncbi:NfeD family protein [Pseudomonas sp. R5(2019)]|uniref:NfeD family protein n=1 Tax=Pseudomonas sp. R5(2019) TaxID=2697566 RepID=UPI001413430C|nr:NfeD family protein [Pseudomonas sp. R5(2019)]NBA97218.1 NfeD family protein [Pseudomonas sp. R5(2019)]